MSKCSNGKEYDGNKRCSHRFEIAFIASPAKDAYRYNMPMVDEVTALMVGDGSKAIDRRDVVVIQ